MFFLFRRKTKWLWSGWGFCHKYEDSAASCDFLICIFFITNSLNFDANNIGVCSLSFSNSFWTSQNPYSFSYGYLPEYYFLSLAFQAWKRSCFGPEDQRIRIGLLGLNGTWLVLRALLYICLARMSGKCALGCEYSLWDTFLRIILKAFYPKHVSYIFLNNWKRGVFFC